MGIKSKSKLHRIPFISPRQLLTSVSYVNCRLLHPTPGTHCSPPAPAPFLSSLPLCSSAPVPSVYPTPALSLLPLVPGPQFPH